MVELSVIIPCFNSSATLPVLIEKLTTAFSERFIAYELILVNDSSRDATWEVIRKEAIKFRNVVGIDLVQNVGQERATLCGLAHSKGRYCITMDDDLQHSIEGVLMLYDTLKNRADADVIIASFPCKKHNVVRNLFTVVQRLIRNVSIKGARNLEFTSFRIIRREIADKLIKMNIGFPKIGLMSLMVTKNIINIPVDHMARPIGKSTYSLRKLWRSFILTIIHYTKFPVKKTFWAGIVLLILSAAYFGLSFVVSNLPNKILLSLIALSTGSILLAISAFGFYLAALKRQAIYKTEYDVREIIRWTGHV